MWGRIYPFVILLIFGSIFKASCEEKGSLTFVIDDTGSMYDDIDQVKTNADKIMDVVFNEKSSLINNMVLITFNDPDPTERTVTKIRSEFKRALHDVYIHNQDPNVLDCEEPSMKGILLGLEKSLPESYMYVFTDASSKDYSDGIVVKEMCQRKQTQIVFVLTGTCRSSTYPDFTVYYDIAAACSGLVFYLKKEDVNQVIRPITETIKGNKTVIGSWTAPAYTKTEISFIIDDQTEYAIISASGSHVSLDVAGSYESYEWIMWNVRGKVLKINHPTPGEYIATVNGHSAISVFIVGRTDFIFSHGFSELEPKTRGETSPQPIADTNVYMSIFVSDPKHSVRIESAEILIDDSIEKTLALTKISKDFYITKPFVAPSKQFKIAVTGTVKASGQSIRRIAKIPVTPQAPVIKLPDKKKPTAKIVEGKSIEVEYDSTIKLTCKVTAYPNPKIEWFNSEGVKMNSKSSVLEGPYKHISYMTISNLVKPDKYLCYALNEEGRDITTINVIVKDPLIVESIPPGITRIFYGTEGNLKCHIKSTKPMQIHWYYANEMTGANGRIATSEKYTISPDGTQLKIRKMDLDLVGKYTCKASLIKYKDVEKTYSTRVKIDGLTTPKVTGPTNTKATKGTTAVLNCQITNGLPKPKITWQFMDKSSSKFAPIAGSDSVLRILGVQDNHAGRYKCVVENVVGKDEHVTTLIVQELPKITANRLSVYQAVEGDNSLEIPCTTTGFPKPVISWKLNGRVIAPSAKYSIVDGALVIRDPKVSDTNSYTCEAKNDVGADSATFRTHILQSPKVSGETTKKVTEGTTVSIECTIVKGEPKPKITWQFMDKSSSKFTPMAGSDSVMRISSVQDKHAGRYKCLAENAVGKDEHVTTLIVQELPKITANRLTVYQAVEGDNSLRIPCTTTGFPKPVISWKLNGRVIAPSTKYSIVDGALVIRDPKVSDTNSYTCEAKNDVGADSATFRTHILQSPKVSGETTKNVREGTTVSIECTIVKGEPKPKITWQFMDKSSSKFAPIAGSDSVLRISGVQDKHAGRYKCVAQNSVGSDEHVITLIVEYPPKIITTKTVYEGVKGDVALRIPCDVIGVPTPEITWKLKGATITPNTKYLVENGALVIKNPTETNSTSYTCEAKNYIGSDSATFETKVEKNIDSFGEISRVYILKGETRKLDCVWYTSKSQSVKWFKEGLDMNLDKPYLEFVEATLFNDGNYTCRVSDNHGHTHTHTYVVDVGFPPKLDVSMDLDDWRGDINDILGNCESVNNKPPVDITWTFNGQVLTNRNVTELGISYKWGHYTCNYELTYFQCQSSGIIFKSKPTEVRSFDVRSSACLINRNLRDANYMPLLLTNEKSWPTWETTEYYTIVNKEDIITLSCPNRKEEPNAFQKFPKQNELKAICIQQDKFSVDGKLYELSDLQCNAGISPVVLRTKVKCSTETSELIRVGYNVAGFLETYEVCFDHAKSMPQYTRTIINQKGGSLSAQAPYKWHKHPGIGEGIHATGFTCKTPLSSCCFSKSQLVNARNFNDGPARNSSYIDPLNVIPSWRPCNTSKTSWEDIDGMVRGELINYNEFVMWSGTHTLQEKHGALIPRYLWKVLRFNKEEAIAVVHVNDPSPTEKDIKCKNICTPGEDPWFKPSDEYTYCCSMSDFLETFHMEGTEVDD